ncbi:uncharacterized protein LOC119741206 [Patiria miniata]|uniref:Death domain-containing protein n=1 Tax=Patiria miniata TaxID=46514 RepID=A0A914B9U4_PATMI|nr:uncharacterized protein LOC119741206 [Patiria miniata]XP_038072866.1 uncharacterized protein LOC119741206 [Patiria miniata]
MALDEKYFRELADLLGPEWQRLGTELDFDNNKMYRFEVDHHGVSNQIFAMLVAWRQKEGVSELGAREKLLTALRRVDRNDLADKLQARTAVAVPQGAPVDTADAACGGVQITANIINPQETSAQPQSQTSFNYNQPQQAHPTTYTYHAPPGTVPYVGRLTITGRNSPVIIGSVSHSTFNFGGGGGSSGDHRN